MYPDLRRFNPALLAVVGVGDLGFLRQVVDKDLDHPGGLGVIAFLLRLPVQDIPVKAAPLVGLTGKFPGRVLIVPEPSAALALGSLLVVVVCHSQDAM